MQFEIGRTSRLGNREVNQDRITAIETPTGTVLVLGDGLGGKPRGDLAAQTLVDSITDTLTMHPLPAEDPDKFLRELIRRAHHDILMVGSEQKPPVAPGTTAVVCLIQQGKAWWAHVGDSRCYLFRDGLPLYRTQDHSYVEKLYQTGQISLQKTHDHPMRNFVTQCIGLFTQEPEVEVSSGVELMVGDVILLCSDGFWEPLDDAQIGSLIQQNEHINHLIDQLAERAESTRYPHSDNTSAVAVRVVSLQEVNHKRCKTETPRKRKRNQLNSAIADIEEAIKAYEDEMKK